MKTLLLIFFNLAYCCVGIIGIWYINWSWIVVLFWLFFAFGNGTIGHRYFAHKQFIVGPIKHHLLAIWCTLSAYSPIIYWQVQHLHHHRHTDTDKDIHSPKNGFFNSLILWPFNKKRVESVFDDRASIINLHRSQKDAIIRITSDYFILINTAFLIMLFLINYQFVFYAGIAFVMEHI
jgi:stearoyl-CoA desaturase (delta-9 desaturase)